LSLNRTDTEKSTENSKRKMNFKNIPRKLASFTEQSKRVWQITRKPSMQEFKIVAAVSAIGIGIVGLLGFLLYALWQPLGGIFR